MLGKKKDSVGCSTAHADVNDVVDWLLYSAAMHISTSCCMLYLERCRPVAPENVVQSVCLLFATLPLTLHFHQAQDFEPSLL